MRLLLCSETGKFSLTEHNDDRIPPYAILSHRWLEDTEEPTFEDLKNGTAEKKPGYEKIRFCGEQARQDGLRYFWVDTCCINKINDAEVSQAINSMFRWYRNATRCYVYLSDVPSPPSGTNDEFNPQSWDSDFWKSKWFTRGWTLQELLAPRSIEFFSCEWKWLGTKRSLKYQIHKITGIPTLVLQGAPLSQFSVDERVFWIERRQTKLEEDKVYSLLGILDVKIPLFYGEGRANAFKRVRKVIDKRDKCIQDLRLTDPRDDKKRIEKTKGGLLKGSYNWILENSEFKQWRSAEESSLLWIRGDPGKGKTMLLCRIIDELDESTLETALLSYFFCQATDSRINNATAVLRGLIYMLVGQQPPVVSHIQKKYDHAGKALFEDANAWVALSEIFTNILQDPSMNTIYLIIDALDECTTDLSLLLDLIVEKSSTCSRARWIVSSRNWSTIEKSLSKAMQEARVCLELDEKSVSAAVTTEQYRHLRALILESVRLTMSESRLEAPSRTLHDSLAVLETRAKHQNQRELDYLHKSTNSPVDDKGLERDRETAANYATRDIAPCSQAERVCELVNEGYALLVDTRIIEKLNDWWSDDVSGSLILETPYTAGDSVSAVTCAAVYYLAPCHRVIYIFDQDDLRPPGLQFAEMVRTMFRMLTPLAGGIINQSELSQVDAITNSSAPDAEILQAAIDAFERFVSQFILHTGQRLLIIIDGLDGLPYISTKEPVLPAVQSFLQSLARVCNSRGATDPVVKILLGCKGAATVVPNYQDADVLNVMNRARRKCNLLENLAQKW